MATYRSIAATETDPQAPITSALMKALDANATAIAEGASGAPVNQAAWHPFDKVTVGDAATGVIYDFATNGLQASVTANFADGYDYMIRLVGVSCSSASAAFRIDGVSVTASLGVASNSMTGAIEITAPTLANFPKWAMVNLRQVAGATGPFPFSTAAAIPYLGALNFSAMASGLTSAVLSFSSGNFDAGAIYLYRRRNYMFG